MASSPCSKPFRHTQDRIQDPRCGRPGPGPPSSLVSSHFPFSWCPQPHQLLPLPCTGPPFISLLLLLLPSSPCPFASFRWQPRCRYLTEGAPPQASWLTLLPTRASALLWSQFVIACLCNYSRMRVPPIGLGGPRGQGCLSRFQCDLGRSQAHGEGSGSLRCVGSGWVR